MQQPKTILVTGGAGFLGSHLCDRLIAGGHDVLCADNFFTGSKRNIEHLIGNKRFELRRHDVTFPLYVEVDAIYNPCPRTIPSSTSPILPLQKRRSTLQSVANCGRAERSLDQRFLHQH